MTIMRHRYSGELWRITDDQGGDYVTAELVDSDGRNVFHRDELIPVDRPEYPDRPEDAWTVNSIAHLTTGTTMGDEATGDEWSVERTNPHYPHARVITTYGVTRYPTDEDGNRVGTMDLETPDEDSHPWWRYSVDERTEFVTTTTPEDFWSGDVDGEHEYGDGSHLDYTSEEEADRECEAMARRDAAMTGIITWNGRD